MELTAEEKELFANVADILRREPSADLYVDCPTYLQLAEFLYEEAGLLQYEWDATPIEKPRPPVNPRELDAITRTALGHFFSGLAIMHESPYRCPGLFKG